MKLLLILLALGGCASVPKETDPHSFTLSDAQMKQCAEQGGCIVISRGKAIKMMKEVVDEALATCGVGS